MLPPPSSSETSSDVQPSSAPWRQYAGENPAGSCRRARRSSRAGLVLQVLGGGLREELLVGRENKFHASCPSVSVPLIDADRHARGTVAPSPPCSALDVDVGVEVRGCLWLAGPPMAPLAGTPTDQLPDVLATGSTDVRLAFISLSAREPDGRDAEYLEWHHLDHRPEQHRLAGLRQSLRLVSTPACRAARAASVDSFDAVDHVMTYLFDDAADAARLLRPRRRARRGRPHAVSPAHRAVHDREPGRHTRGAGRGSRAPTSSRGVRRAASTSSSRRGRHRSTPSSTFPAWPASGGTTAPSLRRRPRPMPSVGRSPTAISTTIPSPPPSGSAR